MELFATKLGSVSIALWSLCDRLPHFHFSPLSFPQVNTCSVLHTVLPLALIYSTETAPLPLGRRSTAADALYILTFIVSVSTNGSKLKRSHTQQRAV